MKVPLGWKIRFDCELNQDEFLSPDMKVFTSEEEMMQLVKNARTPGHKIMAEHVQNWLDNKY